MIRKKNKAKILEFHELFLLCFCHFPNQKKKKKKMIKESSTLKHTLVSNNKESIIESKIMRLS